MFRFHPICGPKIKFTENFRTAERLSAKTDFNNGLIFSHSTLATNAIFQVRIDKRVGLWSGSIELGVTTVCPDKFTNPTIPQSAIELRNGTWLMSSRTVLHDGEILIENYGFDLEKLEEGDTVGLMRTTQGGLVFFVNGTSQGVASPYVPPDVYAVVNLYGKCAQVSLVDVAVSEQSTNTVELVVHEETQCSFSTSENNNEFETLKFHSNCGPLVKLSSHNRTAERRRPMEEFNNAVVLTNRPLRDDELFQIRIDLLVHKWSGSIEFGLTSHNPETFDFPATMTIMRNGTVIMSGNGVLHDGKATNSPYTCFNLDQLQEGDRIGVLKNAAGDVHYFVNGMDQGVATSGINHQVWGAINLYGMAAKVTMVDRNEREEHNLRLNVRSVDYISDAVSAAESDEGLLFHPNCGFHASVINSGRTAHRPNARDDFNHGVVLTNRVLKPNEFFEVRLDKMVTKWAGSIEIGVTTHVPTQLDYPCTMTNVRSGTWMMTGNGIMHNGTSIVDDYGQSLDRLKVGDRVGVVRKENGNLHFFVNGEDQGCAATNIPDGVFGVIDLYGQAAQATVIMHSSNNNEMISVSCIDGNNENSVSSVNNGVTFFGTGSNLGDSYFETQSGDLRFNVLCGKNARVSNNGLTASRPNALGEFNAAIVTSSRALRADELFEVVIERMVDRWSGNIEAGVTSIRPEDLVFPNTMTDIDHDTWMLSGSSIMTGGRTVTNRYNCNLDSLTIGSRVGMMRKSDGTLHYFVNGEDQGIGAYDIPQDVYAIIDLYGMCAQVSMTRIGDVSIISSQVVDSLSQPLINDSSHRFSVCCGKNIVLKNNSLTATRVRHYAHALVFSSLPLDLDELFEIRLTEVRSKWAGCLIIGVTTLCITDDYPVSNIPQTINSIRCKTWFISGSQVRANNVVMKENYGVNLNRLSTGDRIGVKLSPERNLHVVLNGEDLGVAAFNLPKNLHVVLDLYGSTETVTITSTVKNVGGANSEGGLPTSLSVPDDLNCSKSTSITIQSASAETSLNLITFDSKHYGRNIELCNGNTAARRTSGYNQGIVLITQQMQRGYLFQVRIDTLNSRWTSSIMVGVVDYTFDRGNLPWSAFQLRKLSCIICGDCVYQNGVKIKTKYGPNLDFLPEGHTIGLLLDFQSNLHLYCNGVDQGIAGKIGSKCRVLVDLYGQCEQVTILNGEDIPPEIHNLKNLKISRSIDKISKLLDENLVTHCDYMNACIRFKNSLCLPEPYFVSTEPVLCHCNECFRIRGEPSIHKQGDPPADYAVPIGWVRFPLNISFEAFPAPTCSTSQNQMMTSSTSSLSNVLTTWHVAYHGLKIPHVREVMDVGQLFGVDDPEFGTFGSSNILCQKLKTNKDEKTDGPLLTFSPSVEYAAIPTFSPVYQYLEPKMKQKLSARVALQILVQPGSYKVGPASHPNPITTPSLRQDPSFHITSPILDPETIEWVTKEQGTGSTHVSALLVQLIGFFK